MIAYARPLLTPEDLADLTGYSRPAEQRRWLTQHSIRYADRRDGSIATTWGLVEAGMMGQAATATTEPNFKVLRREQTA